MSEYVLARVTRMDNIDIGLFDYDRNNTLYFFVLNSDEQIYLRYGGRDASSPDAYLNLDSIALALARGLEIHKSRQEGRFTPPPRPKPLFAREFPLLVERTIARGNCVECHLIADFQNMHRELDGTLDKVRHLYRSPDIKLIGIHLDVPKGLLVKEARDAVAAAGMRAGDTIAAVEGTPVYTFADLQYAYDMLDRAATAMRITVDREGKPVDLDVALPERWWLSDIRFKQYSVDPRVYFESRPLSEPDKRKLGLDPAGFASEVTHVDTFATVVKSHELRVGDVVYSVDGAQSDKLAHTADLYIKLRKKAGDTFTLGVLRGGKRISMPLKSFRMSFRK
jgi:hypothetical protein